MAERIVKSNIDIYVKNTYGEIQNRDSYRIYGVVALLQNDFEGDEDCTLSSITELTRFYKYSGEDTYITYNNIKNIAKKFCYTDNYGTLSLTITSILNKVNQLYNISKKGKGAYLKGIGFNIKTIISNINQRTPMILNMLNDGRGYYKNHSVTIIGYSDFIVNNKHIYMLELHDNWSPISTFVDYQKLSFISSINYCK